MNISPRRRRHHRRCRCRQRQAQTNLDCAKSLRRNHSEELCHRRHRRPLLRGSTDIEPFLNLPSPPITSVGVDHKDEPICRQCTERSERTDQHNLQVRAQASNGVRRRHPTPPITDPRTDVGDDTTPYECHHDRDKQIERGDHSLRPIIIP